MFRNFTPFQMVHTHTQPTKPTTPSPQPPPTLNTSPTPFSGFCLTPLHILDRKWSRLFYQNQLYVFSLPCPLPFFFGSWLAYLPFVFPSYVIYFFQNLFFFDGHKLDMSFFKYNNIDFFYFLFGRILYIFSLINKVGFFLIEIFYLIKKIFFLTA